MEWRNAVTDLTEQGVPAFETAAPMLSPLLKAEMAERDVRSKDRHGCQLRGMAEGKAEADKFRALMQRNHPDIDIQDNTSERPYARVPIWEKLRDASDDYKAITRTRAHQALRRTSATH